MLCFKTKTKIKYVEKASSKWDTKEIITAKVKVLKSRYLTAKKLKEIPIIPKIIKIKLK